MKDFANVDNITGTFPDVVPQDSTGPATEDGTPLTAAWLADVWGAFQAILDFAGVTPNGDSEKPLDPSASEYSQILDAILRSSGGPGEIVMVAAPAGSVASYPGRLLQLAGQVVDISTSSDYYTLGQLVYCGDAKNATASAFYKTSDAGGTTRSTSGTYMVLPDCRGLFLRSLGASIFDNDREGAGTEEDPGSLQVYQPGNHTHYVGWEDTSGTPVTRALNLSTIYAFLGNPGTVGGQAGTAFSIFSPILGSDIKSVDGVCLTGRGGYGGAPADNTDGTYGDYETRPYNIGFFTMIRY